MKKLSLWLVVLSMMMSLLPQTMVSAADEWFDIELESGTTTASHDVPNSNASGGVYVVANDSLHGNFAENEFTTEADDTYDIWAVLGVDDSAYIGGYTFTLDGDDVFYSKSTELANKDAVGDAIYTSIAIASGAHSKTMKWVKIASAKEIEAGTHTLRSEVSKSTTTDNKMGAMDVVRFVPSAWEWTPDSNFDDPEDMSSAIGGGSEDDDVIDTEWFDLEFEDGEGAVTIDTNSATGRKFIVSQLYSTENKGKPVTMSFTAAEEKTYDIWAVIGVENWDYVGGYTFTLDADDTFYDKLMNGALADSVGDALYNAGDLTSAGHMPVMKWVKLASDKTVTAGAHSLVVTPKAAANGNNAAAMDVVRFVPSEWEWTPDSNFDDPEDMSSAIGGGSEDDEEVGAVTTEWFDIEPDEGTCEGTLLTKTDSDRTYMYRIQGTESATSVTNEFTVEEAGTFDIWAVVGTHSNGHNLGTYTFALDGTSYDAITAGAPTYDASKSLYTGTQVAGGHPVTMVWTLVAEDVLVSADTHSLVSEITACPNGNKFGAIDVVRFVPSDWEWTPGVNFDDPEDMSSSTGGGGTLPGEDEDDEEDDVVSGDNDPTVDGYIHAEAENAIYNAESYTVMERAEASSGKLLVPVEGISTDDTVIGFDVTIPETAGYDVYALVTVVDAVATPWRMLIDGEYYNQPQGGGAGKVYAININLGYNRNMHWVKMAGNIELAAGETSIAAYLPAQKDSRSWLTGIDAIRIVPTKWFWSPDNTLSKPEKSENTNVPNADGALLVEAEKSILSGVMATTKFAKASGGAYVSVKNTQSVGAAAIDFETLADETYDIWAAVATNPVNWLGGYVFTLDDTEVYNHCLSTVDTEKPDLYGETIVLHSGNSSGSASTVRWVKVASKQAVTAGVHTIVAATRQGSGAPNGTGLIDCIAFIPSAWGWQGSDSLALPEKPDVLPELPDDGEDEEEPVLPEPGETVKSETGIFWIESSMAGYDSTVWKTVTKAEASGGTLLDAGTDSCVDPAPYAMSFSFETTDEDQYDIWALSHNTAMHTSSFAWELNGTAISGSAYGNGVYSSGSTGFGGYNHSMTWVKVTESRTLDAGVHSLVAEHKKAGAFANRILAALDCVVIVPSSLKWKPDTAGDVIEGVNASAAGIAANYVKSNFFAGDYSAVTEDIELPESIPTIAGAKITYECDDASVISADGKVSRPYFNGADANVNFNIVATVSGVSSKAVVPMTVIKNAKYTASNVKVSEALAAGAKFEVSADVIVNASAESGITGKAALIIALYNADGTLADIAMDGGVVTPAGDELATYITLPADVEGMNVKVYLTNGFEMSNQLIETIVVE